ncbi:MAG: hypothetical protein Q7S27_05975 [Nanoarchaeota archaeon]|nr:hypothetical protein [Nanoarchaeota archaeon]
MGKGLIIGVVVAILVIILGYFILNNGEMSSTTEDKNEIEGTNDNTNTGKEETGENVITITSAGFGPKTLQIKQGDSVTFVNEDTAEHWPASAMHPTHTVYPGSDIEKCGTVEEIKIFDACKGLKQGEKYMFVFNEKGKWNYHDHLVSGLYGTVEVN